MKDVHTEHCCVVHGCKYMSKDCSVVQKCHPQSYPCEQCSHEDIDPTKMNPETNIYGIKNNCYYRCIGAEVLLYSMGRLKDSDGVDYIIADLFMWSLHALAFVHSVQGAKVIMLSEWDEITKDDYNRLHKEYAKNLGAKKPILPGIDLHLVES